MAFLFGYRADTSFSAQIAFRCHDIISHGYFCQAFRFSPFRLLSRRPCHFCEAVQQIYHARKRGDALRYSDRERRPAPYLQSTHDAAVTCCVRHRAMIRCAKDSSMQTRRRAKERATALRGRRCVNRKCALKRVATAYDVIVHAC